MSSSNLNNLVKTGQLKAEPADQDELLGLLKSGKARLKDAQNSALASESRFDLAYNAAHSIALAALRSRGYRASNRYIVFQAVPLVTDLGPEVWRVLSKAHDCRNLAEYEGHSEIDERLLHDLIIATQTLLNRTHVLVHQK